LQHHWQAEAAELAQRTASGEWLPGTWQPPSNPVTTATDHGDAMSATSHMSGRREVAGGGPTDSRDDDGLIASQDETMPHVGEQRCNECACEALLSYVPYWPSQLRRVPVPKTSGHFCTGRTTSLLQQPYAFTALQGSDVAADRCGGEGGASSRQQPNRARGQQRHGRSSVQQRITSLLAAAAPAWPVACAAACVRRAAQRAWADLAPAWGDVLGFAARAHLALFYL
jgi:hypothetical protein